MQREIGLATTALLLFVARGGRTDERPESAQVDPAELMRAVITGENKIHEVESLRLRIEGKWTRPAEEIASHRSDLQKKYSDLKITPERFPELRPEQKETLELAFDRSRLRHFRGQQDASAILHIWDGREARIHTKYFTHEQESYFLDRDPRSHFFHLECIQWLRAGTHSFWWNPSQLKTGAVLIHHDATNQLVSRAWGAPEDYELGGRQVHRERDCHVLDLRRWSGIFLRRLYVGVDDLRLYGEVEYHASPAQTKEIMERIARGSIPDAAAWEAWLKPLSATERRKAERRCLEELYRVAKPGSEWYFDDYSEISPGLSIPMRHGYKFFEMDAKGLRDGTRRDLRVVEAKVNSKLPDELFVMEMEEGVRVRDARHDPPLSYKFKKDFSKEEWQKILDDSKKDVDRLAEARARMDSRIGAGAVAFPETTWLNTKPLKWEDLKGRVVVLDFCAHWCAPCLNDFPFLESVHGDRGKSGITVIGIHTPAGSVEDVRKMVKEHGLSYPICIDAEKPAGGIGFGMLSSWYFVQGIPHAVVVDRNGKVAAHGSLDDALREARKLASEPVKK